MKQFFGPSWHWVGSFLIPVIIVSFLGIEAGSIFIIGQVVFLISVFLNLMRDKSKNKKEHPYD